MQERLQKIISAAGLASRRGAEELLRAGRITVNGAPAALGQSADPERDDIRLDGRRVRAGGERTYIMLNKPRGYVTTLHDEKGRRTVAELTAGAGARLYPVGRLDMDSEGLIIMTDDGELANAMMHPSHGMKKTYDTTVECADINAALPILRSPLVIDGYRIRPAEVELRDTDGTQARLLITIGEGRNRQVRKMCELAGARVKRLRRISEGPLSLGRLRAGEWRYLAENEISELKKVISGK